MRRAGLSAWSGGMICLPKRNRALAVSSMRDLVRNRIGAPLTIMTSPWRSSKTKLDMRLFLVRLARQRDAMRWLTVLPAIRRIFKGEQLRTGFLARPEGCLDLAAT